MCPNLFQLWIFWDSQWEYLLLWKLSHGRRRIYVTLKRPSFQSFAKSSNSLQGNLEGFQREEQTNWKWCFHVHTARTLKYKKLLALHSIILFRWPLVLRLIRETKLWPILVEATLFSAHIIHKAPIAQLLQRFKAIAYLPHVQANNGQYCEANWLRHHQSPYNLELWDISPQSMLEASPLVLHPPPLPTLNRLYPECNSCSLQHIWMTNLS